MGIKVIFLCAGYGTRLEEDILNCPEGDSDKDLLGIAKAMLPIGGQPLISHWIDSLEKVNAFDGFYIVTNQRFYSSFKKLEEKYGSRIQIVNDNTTSNDNRMGAVAAINFAIESFQLEASDILVIGGDTLLYNDFSVTDFVTEFKEIKTFSPIGGLVTTYTCQDYETTKYGILEVEEGSGKVKSLVEKPQPQETESRLACPCFYLLSSESSPYIKKFLLEKKDAPLKEKDATGNLIKFLIAESSIFAHQISGRFDVGGLESYKECNAYFSRK